MMFQSEFARVGIIHSTKILFVNDHICKEDGQQHSSPLKNGMCVSHNFERRVLWEWVWIRFSLRIC